MKLERAAEYLRLDLNELKSDPTSAKVKVEKAFRELSIEFHPDKNKNNGATEMYQNITNANSKLMAYLSSGNDEDSDFSSEEEEESEGKNVPGDKPVSPEFLNKLGIPLASPEQFSAMFSGAVPSEKEFVEFVMKQVPQTQPPEASGAAPAEAPPSAASASGPIVSPSSTSTGDSPRPPPTGTPAAAAADGKLVGQRVVVCGTSVDSLNGKRGSATGFDTNSERYTVALDGNERVAKFRVTNVRPEPRLTASSVATDVSDGMFERSCPLLGHHVTVEGTSKAAVNGSRGTVTGYDPSSGRYVVELANNANNGRGLKLKPVNVRRLAEPSREEHNENDDDDDEPPPLDGDDDDEPPPLDGEDDDEPPPLDGDDGEGPPPLDGEDGEEPPPLDDDDMPPLTEPFGGPEASSPTTAATPSPTAAFAGRDWASVSEADLPYGGNVMEAQRKNDRAAVKEIFSWRTWREANPRATSGGSDSDGGNSGGGGRASPQASGPPPQPTPPPRMAAQKNAGSDADDDSLPDLEGDDDMPPLTEELSGGDKASDIKDDDWVSGTGGAAAGAGGKKKKNKKKKKKKKAGGSAAASAPAGGGPADGGGNAASDSDDDSDDDEDKAAAATAAAREEQEKREAAAQTAERDAREERARYEQRKKEESEKAAAAAAAREREDAEQAAQKAAAAEAAKAKKAKEAERQRRNFERKQAEQKAKEAKAAADEARKVEKEEKRLAKKEERKKRKEKEAELAAAKKEKEEEAKAVAAAVAASKVQAQAEAEAEGFTFVSSKQQHKQQQQQQQQQRSASRSGAPTSHPPAPSTRAAPTPAPGFEAVTSAPGASSLLWECEVCTYHNKCLSLTCELCSAPRPVEVTAVPPRFNPNETPFIPSAQDHADAPLNGAQEAFDASAYANPFSATSRDATPRGSTALSSSTSTSSATTAAATTSGGEDSALAAALEASSQLARAEASISDPTAAVLWACAVCTFGNHPDRGICEMCHAPKGGSAPPPSTLAAVTAATPTSTPAVPNLSQPGGGRSSNVAGRNASGTKVASKSGAGKAKHPDVPVEAAATAPAHVPTESRKGSGGENKPDEDVAVDGEWTAAELKERRVDSNDGHFYTKEEFVEFYGGTEEWRKAKFAGLCDFFARGHCKDGDRCLFRHVKPSTAAAKPSPPSASAVGAASAAAPAAAAAAPPSPPQRPSSSASAPILAGDAPPPGVPSWGTTAAAATAAAAGAAGCRPPPLPGPTRANSAPSAFGIPPGLGGYSTGGAGSGNSCDGWGRSSPSGISTTQFVGGSLGGAEWGSGWGSPLRSSAAAPARQAQEHEGRQQQQPKPPPPPQQQKQPQQRLAKLPGRDAELGEILYYLGCSKETEEILISEEYDTPSLLQSTKDDFQELGVSASDCKALSSWVSSVTRLG